MFATIHVTETIGACNVIIVTGCARSGTSLIAGIIERCGAQGGETCGPTNANKRGQHENRTIIESVEKPYLRRIGADPMGQYPLPTDEQIVADGSRHDKVVGILKSQGVDLSRPHYIKDAKSCLTWPVWHAAFPSAKWVTVRRPKEQIVASCERTRFMRARKDWGPWVDEHVRRFEQIVDACQAMQIWAPAVAAGNLGHMQALIEWLGLEWDERAVREFIDPDLYSGAG